MMNCPSSNGLVPICGLATGVSDLSPLFLGLRRARNSPLFISLVWSHRSWRRTIHHVYQTSTRSLGVKIMFRKQITSLAGFLKSVVLACYIVVLIMSPAHAYIDPSAGSLVLQLLIGIIAVIGAFFGNIWKHVKNFVASRKGQK